MSSNLRFYSARCGKETVDPDRALQPVMLPFIPKSGNQTFDVVMSCDVAEKMQNTLSLFKEADGAVQKTEDVQTNIDEKNTASSGVEKILSNTVLGVVVPDKATEGRSLKFMACTDINGVKSDDIPLTAPLPSNHPIRAIQRVVLPDSFITPNAAVKAVKKDRSDDVSPLSYLIADAAGNVYLFNNIYISFSDEDTPSPKQKGPKLEASGSHPNGTASLPHGVLVVKSSDIEPMHGALPHYRTPSQAGWVGLSFPSSCYEGASCAHGIPRLFNKGITKSEMMIGRETDNDVRRIQLTLGEASVIPGIHLSISDIESYYPAHGPTSLTYCGDSDQFAAVADGPLVTIFGLSSLSATDAPSRTPIHQIDTRSPVWGVGSLSSTFLSTNLLDSNIKYDTQMNITAENLKNCLIFCCSDRSVNIFDTRKWTKVNIIQNSLKYDAMSIAPIYCNLSSSSNSTPHSPSELLNSFFLVVGGIDTEVRCVPCFEGSSFAMGLSTASVSDGKHSSKGALKKQPKAQTNGTGVTDTQSVPLVSSFRGRLTSAIHGDNVWYGGWKSSWIPIRGKIQGDVGAISVAVGLSSTGNLYVVTG